MTNTNLTFFLNSIWKGKGVKDAEKAMSNLDKRSKGLTDTLKAVATGVAAVKLAGLIKDSAMLAMRVETLGIVTTHMGEQMGISDAQMRGLEQSLIDLGITTQGSRQIIAQMIQSNVDLAHATDIARIAQNAAVVANVDSSEAAQRLTTILQTGNVRMGRTLGLQLNFQKAYKTMAEKIGKAVAALTEEEKMQARVNAVKESAVRIEGVYEKAMGSSGKMMGSMVRLTEELQLLLGEQLLPTFGGFVEMLYEVTHEILEFNRALDYLEESADYAVKTFGPFEWIVDSTGKKVAGTSEEIIALYQGLKAAEEPLEAISTGMAGMGDAADTAAEKIEKLTEAQYLEKAAEAILAGDYEAAQYFTDMAYQAEIAEENTRELIKALDELDGKKVTGEIWIKTFGGSELGGIGSQQLASHTPKPSRASRGRRRGKQHGGRLDDINLVGEAGPELIIGDVVIPADLTRRLIALGLMPGQGFQGGGELIGRTGSRPRTAAPGSVEAWESVGGGPGTATVISGMHEVYGGGDGAAAAEVVVEEIVETIEQSIAEIPGAVADISSQQLAIVQTQMRQQERLTREQTRVLSDILAAVKILATDEGITESLLGGLQTVDLT